MLGSWLDFMMLRVSSNQNNSVIPWFYEICFTDNSWGTSGEGRPGFVLFPSDIWECCSALLASRPTRVPPQCLSTQLWARSLSSEKGSSWQDVGTFSGLRNPLRATALPCHPFGLFYSCLPWRPEFNEASPLRWMCHCGPGQLHGIQSMLKHHDEQWMPKLHHGCLHCIHFKWMCLWYVFPGKIWGFEAIPCDIP